MTGAATLRSRIEAALLRLPIPPLRDIVDKRPSAGRNLDALDGIRGLAVLLVLASHTGAFHLRGQGAVVGTTPRVVSCASSRRTT